METYVASGFLRTTVEPAYEVAEIPDDRLRLIFTCCHPALASDAQIALTLRVLCGLETKGSREPSSFHPPPWHNGWFVRSGRSVKPAFPMQFRM